MAQAYEPFFTDLLTLLAQRIEAVRAGPFPAETPWKNDAQALAIKLFKHSCSLKVLSKETTFQWNGGLQASFIDHASLKSVARSELETLLVFFYVFGSGSDDVIEYRHMTWKLGGLMDRLDVTATTPESKSRRKVDQQQADALVAAISAHPIFSTEPDHRKKRVLLGEWRHQLHWQKLGEAADFHPTYFRDMYSYLCGYSHSSWASVLQISQAKSLQDQSSLAEAIMGMATSVLAHFVQVYSNYFPAAQGAPATADQKRALTFWTFGKAEMGKHYNEALAADSTQA